MGAEDEADSAVFQKKIAAAARSGIEHFIFDWYDDAPFLNRALEQGYLASANKNDVKFCLMWANNDWYNLMPARLHEKEPQLTFSGIYDAAAFDRITDYILRKYIHHPSYLTIDGCPYFSIYELKNLIDRMGGLEITKLAFQRFRTKIRANGFPDLHLNPVAWGVNGMTDTPGVLRELGVSSVTSYTWAHHCNMPTFPSSKYADVSLQATEYWAKAPTQFGVPYHVDVSASWDPSPRTCQSDRYEQVGYPFTPILQGNDPAAFQEVLTRAKAHMDSNPDVPKILTINSWNEWTEGSYLEPESTFGMGYLDAVRNVFK
jgi:hypothetical protein